MKNIFVLIAAVALFAACHSTQTASKSNNEKDEYEQYLQATAAKFKNKPAPNIDLTLVDGSTHRLTDYKGKIVLLNFWFINCATCLSEISSLNELHQQYSSQNVVVLSVALDSPDRARHAVEVKRIAYPVAVNGKAATQLYDINVYPTSYGRHCTRSIHGRKRFRCYIHLPRNQAPPRKISGEIVEERATFWAVRCGKSCRHLRQNTAHRFYRDGKSE